MLAEGSLQVSEGEFRRLPRRDLGRLAQAAQRGADRGLGLLKAFPDAVGRGIAQSACEASESLPLIAGKGGLLEKLPQAVGAEKEPLDFIGGPDTEGSPAAAGTIPVGAEDTLSSDGLAAQMHCVIASQEAVSDQGSGLFAMRTSDDFQLGELGIDFLLGTANPPPHDSLPLNDVPNKTRSIIRC